MSNAAATSMSDCRPRRRLSLAVRPMRNADRAIGSDPEPVDHPD